RTVNLPGPIVPHAALFGTKHGILRREHREPFVGKDDLGVDAVAHVIANPIERVAAGVTAQAILATLRGVVLGNGADARALVALDDGPLVALLVDFDMREAIG